MAAEVSNGTASNAEARRLVEEVQDYEQAVEVLERLPSGLRDAPLFQKAFQLRDRVRVLDQQLAEARRGGTPEDVCDVALQMAQLLPNNQSLAQFIKSFDGQAVNAEARRLVEQEQDYKQALEFLERLPSGLREPPLYQKALQLRDLDQQLAEARRDGTPEDVCNVALQMAQLLPNNQSLSQFIKSFDGQEINAEARRLVEQEQDRMQVLKVLERLPSRLRDAPLIQKACQLLNAEARRLVEQEQDFNQALEVLERLPSGRCDAPLFQKASQLRNRVRELDQQLAEARHDGTPEDVCDAALQMAQLLPNNQGLAQLIASLPKPVASITNSLGMKFVRVPFGWFVQGDIETGTRRVRISRSFHLGVYPVTQAEYQSVMWKNPSYFASSGEGKRIVSNKGTSRFSVEQVSWKDAQMFCRTLSRKEKGVGRSYRLPTEPEWERACRAGTQTAYSCGNSLSGWDANIIYTPHNGWDQSLHRTCAVDSYKPNAFGLYDMHGNVWEWCQDWHAAYDKQDAVDPKGPASGQARVLRGGSCGNDMSFGNEAAYASSAYRRYHPGDSNDHIGFRVVCESSVRT